MRMMLNLIFFISVIVPLHAWGQEKAYFVGPNLKTSLQNSLNTNVTLQYTDDLWRFNVNWDRPKVAPTTETPPSDLVLPNFDGDAQIYGKISLGNSSNRDFYFAVDLYGKGENLQEVKFYFDRNQNGDLTDDGDPLQMPALHSRKVPTFYVPYKDGSYRPYSFRVYVYFAEWAGTYHVAYYRDCGWTGEVKIAEDKPPIAVLLLDDNTDGLYDSEEDYLCVDLNGDGVPNGSYEGGELIRNFNAFYLGDSPYVVDKIAPDGTFVSFRRAPEGELSGFVRSASTGEPLAGVKIEVWASIHRETFTREDGSYSMKIAEGCWTLRASMPGFIPELKWRVQVLGNAVTMWKVNLQPIPIPCAGTVTLYSGDSYDFAKGKRGKYSGGDFYFSGRRFYANNFPQRGLQDLGDLGETPLREVIPPQSGYTRFGVDAIVGHTYVSLAQEGEEGCFIIFRVTNITEDAVTLDYYLVNPLDADRDDLGDDWELQIIEANLSDSIDTIEDVNPEDDFDGDGYSNKEEFQNRTDPTDPTSFPSRVHINDPNLEAAIREAIGKPKGSIYPLDLKGLNKLIAARKNITDLSGLEYCVNLQVLDLHGNQISDVTPLRSLINLQELNLEDNQISDVTPLENLTDLRELDLKGNQISDISPLAGLTNLQRLDLRNNQIVDMSALESLTDLRILLLDGNRIKDISPIAKLTRLGESWSSEEREGLKIHLGLSNNQIEDISPLLQNERIDEGDGIDLRENPLNDEAYEVVIPQLLERGVNLLYTPKPSGEQVKFADPNLEAAIREALNIPERPIYESDLQQLKELRASNRGISDLTGIERCVNLQKLYLNGNRISDVTPLKSLINLQGLDLSGNRISDVTPLRNLTNLEWLDLGFNPLSDVTPLGNLSNLEWLYLGWNQISDVTPLGNLTNLQELYLGGNQINDVAPLGKLINLQKLWLNDNRISDITPLNKLINLWWLNLGNNKVSDVAPLGNLTNLRSLYLQGNQIIDVTPLENLTNLEWLSLENNQVIDVTPLGNLINLRGLYLGGNRISDVASLGGLVNLQRLYLQNNQISDISPLASLVNLQWLDLRDNRITDISALKNLTNLKVLFLDGNQIRDISPIAEMAELGEWEWWWMLPEREGIRIHLGLSNNQIKDISPLVDNPGINEGDGIDLRNNPLSDESLNTLLPQLIQRGVNTLITANNFISGKVISTSGFPVAGAYVFARLTSGGLVKGAETDMKGNYTIANLTPGKYILGVRLGWSSDAPTVQYFENAKTPEDATPIPVQVNSRITVNFAVDLSELGYVTRWLVLGPLKGTGGAVSAVSQDFLEPIGGEANVQPSEGDAFQWDGETLRWEAREDVIGDIFDRMYGEGTDYATAYLVTYLRFEEEGDVKLWIGSDDAVAVYLNGERVWLQPVVRDWMGDQDKLVVHVRKGWNRLLVKVCEQWGEWSISVRFPEVRPAEVSLSPMIRGDVSGNGEVTAHDASLILRYLVGKVELSEEQLRSADVSGNGEVTAYDAGLILQYVVGLIDSFPEGQGAPVGRWESRTLSIPVMKGRIGRRIRVPIIVDDAEGIISGELEIEYERDGLRFVKAESAYDQIEAREEEGVIKIAFAGAEDRSEGEVVWLVFEVKGGKWDYADLKVRRVRLNEGVEVRVKDGRVEFIPSETVLLQNYPNPFNPDTWIPFRLAEDGRVVIRIYDVRGRLVRELDLGWLEAGSYTMRSRAAYWDGRNELGERVASGVYIYQLQANGKTFARKMVILK